MVTRAEAKQRTDQATFKFHQNEARKGNNGSMVRLAELYLTGTGCKPDTAQAQFWFKQAAEHGDQGARQELAKITTQSRPLHTTSLAANQTWEK